MIKIAFVPTRRNVFDINEAIRHKNLILEHIKSFNAEIIDINDINEEGILYDESDISKIIKKCAVQKADGIFFPHVNFGSEDLVAKTAAQLKIPVLIWGPRDDAPLPDGVRTRDSQCGLFATGKVLRRFNVPFTYVTNCRLSDKTFADGLNNFIGVCAAVKSFRSMRILQISTRPAGFWTMICNEGELLEKFGIQIHPVTLPDIYLNIEKLITSKPQRLMEEYKKIYGIFFPQSEVEENDTLKLAALKLTIKDLCEKYGCSAASIQCWDAFQDVLNLMPCAVNGLLADENLPVVCETDIHGAISAILLQSTVLWQKAVFFADFTVRHPENDNAELLWHCGNFPPSLADKGEEIKLGRHFIFPGHCVGTGEWKLKDGEITICRFDGDHGEYSLFVGEGKATKGPRSRGTYVWFEVDNWSAWERKLVEGPYVHHCAGVYAKTAHILIEAVKYIPGLKIDIANEDAESIIARLQ